MKGFLVFIAVFVLALLLGGLLLPSVVVVERSATIQRPVSTVFTVLAGFGTWERWAPWGALDPDLEVERSGPVTGVGARVAWSGDPSRAGQGWQEVTGSDPYRRVELDAELGLQAPGRIVYRVDGDGLGSLVTWRFEADVTQGRGFAGAMRGRYFGWFLERWVAADFERGLRRLEAFAEELPTADFAGADLRRVTVVAEPVALVSGIEGTDADDVGDRLADAFRDIARWTVRLGVEMEGVPLTLARASPDGRLVYTAAVPIGNVPPGSPADPRVEQGATPAGEAACIAHTGPANDTLTSYARLDAWLAARGERGADISWERYLESPAGTDGGVPTTEICLLLDSDP